MRGQVERIEEAIMLVKALRRRIEVNRQMHGPNTDTGETLQAFRERCDDILAVLRRRP